MKRTKLKTLFLTGITIAGILGNAMFVTATEVQDEEHPIGAMYIDKNGNEIIIYEKSVNSKDLIKDSIEGHYSSPIGNNKDGASFFSSKPTYHSWIESYNNYSSVMARSESTEAIDKMKISCAAFYQSGNPVGSKSSESLNGNGWSTKAFSVLIEVPSSPLNLKIYSADSTHTYTDSRYGTKMDTVHWKK